MSQNDIRVGDDVKVVSGTHQGRQGRVVQMRDIAVNTRDPEPYAVIEFSEVDCFNESHTDHISVPAKRLELR